MIAVPCATTRRDLPSHIESEPATSGLEQISHAKCEDIKTISVRRLVARLGAVDESTLFAISGSLRFLLDF